MTDDMEVIWGKISQRDHFYEVHMVILHKNSYSCSDPKMILYPCPSEGKISFMIKTAEEGSMCFPIPIFKATNNTTHFSANV